MLRSAFLSTKFCLNCSFVLANYKRHRKQGISTIIKISYQFFISIITFTFLPWTNSTYGWLSKWQSGLSHSCPPPVSSFFLVWDSFLFLHQLYNRTINFMQCELFFLSLFSPFNIVWTLSLLRTHLGKMCLSGFHLDTFSVNFHCCEILLFFPTFGYLLQLVFATSLFISPLSSWYAKQMSLYREIVACQYADCIYWARACRFRISLIH